MFYQISWSWPHLLLIDGPRVVAPLHWRKITKITTSWGMEQVIIDSEDEEIKNLRQSIQQWTAETLRERIQERIGQGKTSLRVIKLSRARETIESVRELMDKPLPGSSGDESPYQQIRSLLDPTSDAMIGVDLRGLKLRWVPPNQWRLSMRNWSCGLATLVTILALGILTITLAAIVNQL